MSETATKAATRDIIVEEVFPHAPEVVWKTLTAPELMSRWLPMPSAGFDAAPGKRFTYQTTPAGEWDGVIHCQVVEVVPNERLVYSWRGGHESNIEGYGARLDAVVTFTLTKVSNGTRVRLVHSGFASPRNDTAFRNMGEGWKRVVKDIGGVAAEQAGG